LLRALREAAEAVAENIREEGITVGGENGSADEIALPVEVYSNTGAEPSATVVLAHPAGRAVQAKHGSLTKAAAQTGLKFRGNQ
jgi:hypothetical protein